MKLYLRLLWANSFTRLALVVLCGGLLIQFNILHLNAAWVPANMGNNLIRTSIFAFSLTGFGISSFWQYRMFVKYHNTGRRKITQWKESLFPCTRAAYQVALEDLTTP